MDLVKSWPGRSITAAIAAFVIASAFAIKLDTDAYRARSSGVKSSANAVHQTAGENPRRPHDERESPGPQEPVRVQFCGTSQWQSLIEEGAARFSLPSEYIHAVMRAESAGCMAMNGKPTTSSAGAMGLMQLMPRVWQEQRKRLALGTNAHDPLDNILAGTSYLKSLTERYGWPGAAAAYHAGPTRFDDYLSTGRPLPLATLTYLDRIERSLRQQPADRSPNTIASLEASTTEKPSDHSVFATGAVSKSSQPQPFENTSTSSVFVPLRRDEPHATSTAQESKDVQPP